MLCKSIKNNVIKIVLIASLAVVVVAAPLIATYAAPTVSAAANLDDLKKKQEEIKKEQQATSAKLDSLKSDQAKQQEYKDTLDEQLANVKQEKYVIQDRISTLDGQINQKESEIAGKQKDIDANFKQLGKRLDAIYLAGEATTLEILLHSNNVTDLMDNMQVVQSVTEHDKKLIENLKTALSQIKDQKTQIESDRKEVAASKVELDKKQDQINALVEESNRVLKEIRSNVDQANVSMQNLDEQSKEASAAVDKWFADYYADQAKQQAIKDQIAQNQHNNSGNSSGGGSSGGHSGGVIHGGVSASGWMWPAPGIYGITSNFYDTSGRTSRHGALDIATAGCSGSPIVASRDGIVMNALPDPYGYGNYVMIDHGDGYVTVYAHMSKKVAMPGQFVKQGQIIGYIGSTGHTTGPHVHFEIRQHGIKVDPAKYVGY